MMSNRLNYFKGYYNFILFFLMLSLYTNAQYNSIFYDNDKINKGIRVFAEYEIASNGFQNGFTNKFLYGGYISKEIKDRALNKMHQFNNVGFSLNYGVNTIFGKKHNYKFMIGYKSQTSFAANYTKDFFKLVFYGNKPFLGNTAKLSGTQFKLQKFQEINFGCLFQQNDTSAKYGISVSIVGGDQYLDVDFKNETSLYTSYAGDSLGIHTNIDAVYSTKRSKNVLAFNGIGASSNFYFEAPYRGIRGTKHKISIYVNDLGFINWNKNTSYLTSDTNFIFDGIHINGIDDVKDSNLVKNTFKGVVDSTRKAHNSLLSSSIVVINKTHLNKYNINISFGIRYIFNRIYKPYFFAEQEIPLLKNFFIIVHEGYGGYSRSNFGLTLNYTLKKWYFKLGTNQLQGYIIPKWSYGQGGFFSMSRQF